MEVGYSLFFQDNLGAFVCKGEFLPDVCPVLNSSPYEELFTDENHQNRPDDLHQAENVLIRTLVDEFNNSGKFVPVSAKNVFIEFEDENERRAYLRVNASLQR